MVSDDGSSNIFYFTICTTSSRNWLRTALSGELGKSSARSFT